MEIKVIGDQKLKNGNSIISPLGLKNINCAFAGKNNRLVIKSNKLSNLNIRFPSDNALVIIDENSRITGFIRVGYNSTLIIGKGSSSTAEVKIIAVEDTKIIIGDDCMFATDVIIRSEDAHAIYSTIDGSRINTSEDIIIGAHVWLGEGGKYFIRSKHWFWFSNWY